MSTTTDKTPKGQHLSPAIPDSYVPFGPEWEKEVMKLPKKFIVEMLRKALMANQAAKDSQEMAEAREREENLRK